MKKDETFVPGTGGSYAIVDGADIQKLEGTEPAKELPLESKVPVPASEFTSETVATESDVTTSGSKSKAKASA